ncbi:U-box domain-containing protein [Paracoccidioides lutzii Pb01]|uniref:E3 ubiquitin-protein ligase CHIP n=1 Tax=Paracoccidioides lutzii (strain ATCC MYA-826 / Pb01) TaxID=502779 RepID=C1H6S0_PARBA|nr:U-box domain-containing protein [Paracoccidioides lutzii Pb01]EEH35414.1 U-box domain-containing protein [Paracoccidioides lutzii Pb01]
MAYELKAKGNVRFKEGDYVGAEDLYSQAIQKNSHEPSFFNNRALARLKLQHWEGAEHDARIAIDLFGPKNPASVKSSYYLSQALLELQRPAEAHDIAYAAYKASLETRNPNAEPLSRVILRAKQSIWAAKETARLRNQNETLKRLEDLLQADLDKELSELRARLAAGEIGQIGFKEDEKELLDDGQRRLDVVRDVFASSMGEESMKERVVPDYLIDSITFEIMHDPVVTPSGHSFERTSILKHMQHSPIDPITRTPMTISDLRPNFALKAACNDFLAQNGWAVDW